jgi:serine/threonine-protein kinase
MTEAYPSAPLLAQLEEALHEANPTVKAARAWRLVMQATANPDAGVVQDFATDNGLVVPLGQMRVRTEQGPRETLAWTDPCDGSEMVWIPPGPFLHGTKRQKATVPGFSLARHPVTNAQFKRFLDETKYTPPSWHPRNDLFLMHWQEGNPPAGQEAHPVTWVSFVDALYYCRWAGLTLPTEWLWEKAARGRDGKRYPWGDQMPWEAKAELINVRSDGTVPVGSYPRTRSIYGCQDLVGNVAEWCQTTDGDNPELIPAPLAAVGPPEDPEKIVVEAVRGSCYLRTDERRMATWHRRRLSRTRRNGWVGFRPACLMPVRPV